MLNDSKPTNPKDAVGIRKWRVISTVPLTVVWEIGVALLEGARKYGAHNYRVAGVRASVYVDAAFGHIGQWWEGEDIDPDSGLSHITKAIASLVVLRDAILQDMLEDDRPPKANLDAVRNSLGEIVTGLFDRYPDSKGRFTQQEHGLCTVYDGVINATELAFEVASLCDAETSKNTLFTSVKQQVKDYCDGEVERRAEIADFLGRLNLSKLASADFDQLAKISNWLSEKDNRDKLGEFVRDGDSHDAPVWFIKRVDEKGRMFGTKPSYPPDHPGTPLLQSVKWVSASEADWKAQEQPKVKRICGNRGEPEGFCDQC